jgi:hypothetical protein
MRVRGALAGTVAALLAPAVATAEPVNVYALRHPKREHCRRHYLPWTTVHHHNVTVRCVHLPPPYAGPWDAAHEPATISNVGVTASRVIHGPPGDTLVGDFVISLARSVWCPHGQFAPITVTFSTPSGWSSSSLESEASCGDASWNEGRRHHLDINSGERNTPPIVGTDPEPSELARLPFFYEVSGVAGVIAKAPMSAFVVHEKEELVETHIHDISRCEREGRDIYAEHGERYCRNFLTLEGEGTNAYAPGGWPSA